MGRRPRPVLFVNMMTAIAESVVPLVLLMGWADWSHQQIGGFMVFIIGVSTAVKTYLAQSRVTPNADPRDSKGYRLRPTFPMKPKGQQSL